MAKGKWGVFYNFDNGVVITWQNIYIKKVYFVSIMYITGPVEEIWEYNTYESRQLLVKFLKAYNASLKALTKTIR